MRTDPIGGGVAAKPADTVAPPQQTPGAPPTTQAGARSPERFPPELEALLRALYRDLLAAFLERYGLKLEDIPEGLRESIYDELKQWLLAKVAIGQELVELALTEAALRDEGVLTPRREGMIGIERASLVLQGRGIDLQCELLVIDALSKAAKKIGRTPNSGVRVPDALVTFEKTWTRKLAGAAAVDAQRRAAMLLVDAKRLELYDDEFSKKHRLPVMASKRGLFVKNISKLPAVVKALRRAAVDENHGRSSWGEIGLGEDGSPETRRLFGDAFGQVLRGEGGPGWFESFAEGLHRRWQSEGFSDTSLAKMGFEYAGKSAVAMVGAVVAIKAVAVGAILQGALVSGAVGAGGSFADAALSQLDPASGEWSSGDAARDALVDGLYAAGAALGTAGLLKYGPKAVGLIGDRVRGAAKAAASADDAAAVGVQVSVQGEGAAARLGARGASRGPLPVREFPWTEDQTGRLIREGSLGETTFRGRVTIQPGLDPVTKAETLRHEFAHRWLTPLGDDATTVFRQDVRGWFYNRSQIMRGLEEAVAETYGTRSLARGAAFPFTHGYVTPTGWGVGDLIIVAGAGGTTYVVKKALDQ